MHYSVLVVISPELFQSTKETVQTSFDLALSSGDPLTLPDEWADPEGLLERLQLLQQQGRYEEALTKEAIRKATEVLLAPYEEGDSPYQVFSDQTEEVHQKTQEVITSEDYLAEANPQSVGKTIGQHYWDRFHDPSEQEYILEELENMEYPFDVTQVTETDLVSSLYFGHEYRKIEGKKCYGYMSNPNRKWDWYVLGGRYANLLYTKDGNPANSALASEIDVSYYQEASLADIQEFWEAYQRHMEAPGDDLDFIWVRGELVRLGIPVLNAEEVQSAWRDRTEVPKYQYGEVLTWESLMSKYREHFSWSTYAALTEEGWFCRENHGTEEDWDKSFFSRFILDQPEGTYLVVVDCHT